MFIPEVILNLIQLYLTHMHHGDVIAQLEPFCTTIRYIEFMNSNCVPLARQDPFVYVEYGPCHHASGALPHPYAYNGYQHDPGIPSPIRESHNRMLYMIRGYAKPFPGNWRRNRELIFYGFR